MLSTPEAIVHAWIAISCLRNKIAQANAAKRKQNVENVRMLTLDKLIF